MNAISCLNKKLLLLSFSVFSTYQASFLHFIAAILINIYFKRREFALKKSDSFYLLCEIILSTNLLFGELLCKLERVGAFSCHIHSRKRNNKEVTKQ
ncbi:hypothetical protein ES332_A01G059900v1 [Gossypium tomentosum]|uniref:Uncharacterized protein n=1 Tax=Gossypium tomentosum TaxID=34277 RepID=A0A5D2RQX6_GOSTO|nr:hypothetical protein ES332_A01G059900v1 [Gossypium tomentosum]